VATPTKSRNGRLSLLGRLAWAVCTTLLTAACFTLAQQAGALLPELQLLFFALGVPPLIVGVYKLFYGRKSKRKSGSADIDLDIFGSKSSNTDVDHDIDLDIDL
jgi:hypothetical protein